MSFRNKTLVHLCQKSNTHLLKINEAIFVWVPAAEISCKIVFVLKGCIFVLHEIESTELRELLERLWTE